MANKDSYWFRHDTTAGRGLRLRKIQHIYTHWGKGIYWDVIEILREQENYTYPNDESSLGLLSSLVGCSDQTKFLNWYRDCVKIDLLQEAEGVFFSLVLSENMRKWETKKRNGSGIGSESEANNPYKKREEEKREHKKTFEIFRLLYGGTKRGLETEFDYFCKHKDWEEVLPLLLPSLRKQIDERNVAKKSGQWVAEWKHLKTWIYNRCWENETVVAETPTIKPTNPDEYENLHRK